MDKQKQKLLIKTNVGRGKEEAISRNTLSILTDISEDRITRLVREMRYFDGELICSYQSAAMTYYFYPKGADDATEMLNHIMQKEERILKFAAKLQEYIQQDTGGVL